MANMSYCRFENTVNDMRDCISAIQECGSIENYIEQHDPSDYELASINSFMSIINEFQNDPTFEICDKS